jgi:predicted RNase H-like HicB family nuclease
MGNVNVVIEKTKTGYAAWISELAGCVGTGATVDLVKKGITEAVQMHLNGMKEDGLCIPEVFSTPYTLCFSFDVETFLNHYNTIFTKRALSRITGINESLLSQYAAGHKRPRRAQSKKIENGIHQLARELLQVTL